MNPKTKKTVTQMYYESSKYIDDAINYFEKQKKDFNRPIIKIETDLISGAIGLESLSTIIEGLQNTFTSAINNIMGNGSSVGKIPTYVKNLSKLAISEVEAGSFIIKLGTQEHLKEEPIQLSFVESEEEKLQILEELIYRISSIEENDFEELKNKFGNRTVISSRKWFDQLAKDEVSFKYKKRMSNEKYEFNHSKIVDIANKLSNVVLKEENDTILIMGKLVSYQLNNNKISLDTGEEEITIKILDDSLEKHEVVVNSFYSLRVDRKQVIDNFDRINYEYSIPTIEETELVSKDNQG
ncbi:hypothetical protein FSZ06_05670 [Enterococcus gallinarum]|uniref:hypothetical protein n=1 Tax=Enterococcus TaxID=1350 RepID=UPI000F060BBF|nr:MULTISPECIES: hypothetical protein [Enterococcus]TXJ87480.1 hypothetical protein FSZ06_05670 [Enterococcus gallinarum]